MISREEITALAELARLQLTEEESTGLQKDISNILDYVGQLSSTPGEVSGGKTVSASLQDVRGWSADTVLPPVHNVMREDTPRSENDLLAGKGESLKAAFPKREGEYNVVRKIIQKDE